MQLKFLILLPIPLKKILEKNDVLKIALLKRTRSSEERLQQLLSSEELGDRKPSQLFRGMQQLVGNKIMDPAILRQLFIQRLPRNIQLILASTTDRTKLTISMMSNQSSSLTSSALIKI